MRQFLANQTLLTRCLQDRGFDYQPIPYEDEWRYVDLVSPLDRGYAESQGYHLPQIVPHDPNTALYDTPAFDAVYEECGLAANARAFRVADRFAELSSTAAADLRARLEQFASGSEGVMVLEAWAECLNEKGYEYATPQDAQLKFVEAPEVTPEEIRVRLADLECDEQVGYTRTRYEWESSNADAWFAQNEAQVALLTAEAESVVDSLVELEAELAANSGGG